MRLFALASTVFLIAACDPYNYSRFDSMDASFQKYIGFHKRCLAEMRIELGLEPDDKKDWHSAEYRSENTGEHVYDIAFNSVKGTDDWVLCNIEVENLDNIKVEKRAKLVNSNEAKIKDSSNEQ